jgi:hypothetical protein
MPVFTYHEQATKVNKPTENTVFEDAVQALRGHGLVATAQKEPRAGRRLRADAWLRIGKDRQHVDYVVEVKRPVTPATLGAVLTQLRHIGNTAERPPLLVTDYLTPPIADQLRVQEQQFVDTAGNAYLVGPGLLVYVTGRRPKRKQAAARPSRAFTTAGLKVLFGLICDLKLADAPHRAIAAAAGVALGAIPAVLADLQLPGHLLVAGKRRRLNATKRLLDDWALAYARTLRAKTLLGTYVAPDFETWKKWKLDPQHARWGGEPAAYLLVRYLKPGVLTIYANKLPTRLMVEQRLVVAGRLAHEHLVEMRKPFWGEALRTEGRTDTVPPALVYADLLATGDGRCIETAQMVYEGYLARLFPAA